MSTQRALTALPTIDISPLTGKKSQSGEAVVRSIGDACHEIGFMVIRGHGIPEDTTSRLRGVVRQFFARPLEEKSALSITRDNYRGYIPLGFFTPNSANGAADRYEGYKLHAETDATDPICADCNLYGPNKWPDQPVGFREAVLDYWQECDRVASTLLDALAVALGVDPAVFRRAFKKPLTNMTLLHYPPQAPGADGFGIHPHKDTDALTIVAPDPVGGLYVRQKGRDEWISADAPDDALIVNIGDMLETWSGGYYVSTPHKVVNSTGQARHSFPYFAVPRFDVRITPLCEPLQGFERADLTVGDVSREIWQSNWPDAAAVDDRYDPATL
ncbi:MAG: isopenicillin N synthase family oxygenase [Woeseiaceae bacterium]|nr:isopenicillin N synthase family oxygenase [Woeseiaceae bacterium]